MKPNNDYLSFIINFIEYLNNKEQGDKINYYLQKYIEYKEFTDENLDKEKFALKQIEECLENSEFEIKTKLNNILNKNIDNIFKGIHHDRDDKIVIINYEKLLYLNDRALGTKQIDKTEKRNKKNGKYKMLYRFCI